jgi:hypothetical protein
MTAVDLNRKTTDAERAMFAARPTPPLAVYEHARQLEAVAWHRLQTEPTPRNRIYHDRARAYLLDVVAGRGC